MGAHANGPTISGAGSVLVSVTDGVVDTHVAVAETVMVPAFLLVLSRTPALPPSTATVTGLPESVSDVLWPPYMSLTHEAGVAVKVTLQDACLQALLASRKVAVIREISDPSALSAVLSAVRSSFVGVPFAQ